MLSVKLLAGCSTNASHNHTRTHTRHGTSTSCGEYNEAFGQDLPSEEDAVIKDMSAPL